MKLFPFFFVCLSILSHSILIFAEPVKIATWNIAHLCDENDEGSVKRDDDDYEVLAKYAKKLSADIIALQEVEGAGAAKRVFDPDAYNFYFSSRDHKQLTGFAVRKHIDVQQNPDYEDLDVSGGLRYGTDITVTVDDQQIRFLSIHLKSSCWDDPLNSTKDDCQKLNAQVPILEAWIDERATENVPFIVLGDFNRRFDHPDDTFYNEIDDANPSNADLTRITDGLRSNCWGGKYPLYIDHILMDRLTVKWYTQCSFKQLVYDEQEYSNKISDHCPISMILDITP
jgi:endonuclease/exonuclease/phosphatase family metal-dependent hydrolase